MFSPAILFQQTTAQKFVMISIQHLELLFYVVTNAKNSLRKGYQGQHTQPAALTSQTFVNAVKIWMNWWIYKNLLPAAHKGSPQRGALHVWFGCIFYAGCSSWCNPKGICISSSIKKTVWLWMAMINLLWTKGCLESWLSLRVFIYLSL